MKRLLPAFALLFSLHAVAQVALISHTAAGCKSQCGSNGSITVTTPAINTTGARMIAICSSEWTQQVPPTDSSGNVYQKAISQNEDDDSNVGLWYALSPITSASQTFTQTGQSPALAVMAFSNVASGPDQQNTSDSYGQFLTSGNVTPTNNNELIVSCLSGYPDGFSATVSPLTVVDSLPWNGGYSGSVATYDAYRVQTTASTLQATWNMVNGNNAGATTISTFFSTLSPAPLTIPAQTIPEAVVGTPFSYQMLSTGGVGPITWTLTSGTLPNGLTMSGSGVISGTPTAPVSATPLTFHVLDSQSHTANSSGLSMTVVSTPLSMGVGTCTGSKLNGTQYQAFGGCTLTAIGGVKPYAYSWVTYSDGSYASLPEGLSIGSSTGAISGTVYGQGTYVTQFQVADALGTTATTTAQFSIAGNNSLGGCSLFPSDSAFHINVSTLPVDTSPAAPIYSGYQSSHLRVFFGNSGDGSLPNGIPFIRVPYNQPNVDVSTTQYQSYFTSGPFPPYAPPEASSNNNGDRHVLVLQEAGGGNPCSLWEMWQGISLPGNTWTDSSNAVWSNVGSTGSGAYAMLPQDTGSSDAAGLPVAPLLVNADEVIGTGTPSAPNGKVQHPVRFTTNHMLNRYVWPGTAHAGVGSCSGGYSDGNSMLLQGPGAPTSCTFTGPAGEIYRLKSSVATPACAASSPQAAIIIQGFRSYGIILADNGLTGGMIGTPDARWSDDDLACLTSLTLSNFEPVNVLGTAAVLTPNYNGSGYSAPVTSYQTITTGVKAALTSPTPGSTLSNSSATFTWSAGVGVTKYEFRLGTTGPGSSDVYNAAEATTTALTTGVVSNIPTNGATLYARIYSYISGVWQHNDYTYKEAPAGPAVLTSPTPGSTLSSSSATFTWSAGVNATKYEFRLGTTGPGSSDVYNAADATTTALTSPLITNIPTNGATLYARIYSYINAVWQHNDYTYTEAPPGPAVLTSPTPGSTLTGSSATFTWSAGVNATKYEFRLGTTGPGSSDVYNAADASTTALTSPLITNIPTTGATLYARIYSYINAVWQHNDYTYTEARPVPAVLTSPTPGSTLPGSSATFSWTAGVGVTKYEFRLGTTGPGSSDVYNAADATTTALTSPLITNIPTNGATLYARIYSYINGVWQHNDYTYKEQ